MANSVRSVALKNLAKGLARRLLPDSVVSRYRWRRYGQGRHNVLVLLDVWRSVDRWLRSTPSTYRFQRLDRQAPAAEFDTLVDDSGQRSLLAIGRDIESTELAARGVTQTGLSVAVVGRVRFPGRVAFWTREPLVEPTGVAAHRDAISEIGGTGPHGDVTSLYLRLRDTGREMALIPRQGSRRLKPQRRDLIDSTVVCVLAAVPMHDIGGGSRAAQLTLELLERGLHVVYISLFPSYEPTDLGIRFVHERLEQYSVGEIGWDLLAERAREPGWVLVEAPSPEAVRWAMGLKGDGWRVCYDIIDLWSDPALGSDWYRSELEVQLIDLADLVTVSAPDLSDHAGGVPTTMIPNAVNADVFAGEPGPIPDDMPVGSGPILGYHGSLYGEWFDWEGLRELANSFPESRVVLIGDDRSGLPIMPSNVHFLGLKAQRGLRDYVSCFDVGLIPFRLSDTTHAVSPLKAYEYLACGVAVAAPPLRSLGGLDGVHTSDSLIDAVNAALEAPAPDPGKALQLHSWANRVDTLLEAMRIDSDTRREGSSPRVFIRPAVNYESADRVIERGGPGTNEH